MSDSIVNNNKSHSQVQPGDKFARLIVKTISHIKKGKRYWVCECDCGGTVVTSTTHLRSGNTRSCGCILNELIKSRSLSRRRNSPEYQVWMSMRSRCNNAKHRSYAVYGGRGIKVCKRWDDFDLFLKDMGPRPSLEHSIDRINNDGNYEPANCKWSTKKEQNRNSSNNLILTLNGVEKAAAQWAEDLGMIVQTIYSRKLKGWSDEQTLTTPLLHQSDYSNGSYKGSQHPLSKLTEADVAGIRELNRCGLSATKIAKKFGVSRSNIQLIVKRKTWSHI